MIDFSLDNRETTKDQNCENEKGYQKDTLSRF